MGDHVGGDSACWLSQVCPECGAMLDDLAAPCWRCGLRPGETAQTQRLGESAGADDHGPRTGGSDVD